MEQTNNLIETEASAVKAGEPRKLEANHLQFIFSARQDRSTTFTLVSTKSGARFTYKMKPADRGGWFVKGMFGSNNETDYRYLGFVTPDRQFKITPKSTLPATSPQVKAIDYTISRLVAGDLQGVEVWHAGSCGHCGMKLTVPDSIDRGFGPDCASKLGIA